VMKYCKAILRFIIFIIQTHFKIHSYLSQGQAWHSRTVFQTQTYIAIRIRSITKPDFFGC
jgi:hypothetical protein